jgi:hypothetical protein
MEEDQKDAFIKQQAQIILMLAEALLRNPDLLDENEIIALSYYKSSAYVLLGIGER